MTEIHLDSELQAAADQVRVLTRRVEIDAVHRLRLREELLRRHQELYADSTQRAASTLGPQLRRPRRLTLVAPAALAAAVVLSLLPWRPQLPGTHQQQTAAAARITRALVRSVPTVEAWQWTYRQERGGAHSVTRLRRPLRAYQRLYIYYGRPYLYSSGRWYVLSADIAHATAGADWQWAFAALPQLLRDPDVRFLVPQRLHGQAVDGIGYHTSTRGHDITITAWVSRKTGLLLRLDRIVAKDRQVVERDSVTYAYNQRGT